MVMESSLELWLFLKVRNRLFYQQLKGQQEELEARMTTIATNWKKSASASMPFIVYPSRGDSESVSSASFATELLISVSAWMFRRR